MIYRFVLRGAQKPPIDIEMIVNSFINFVFLLLSVGITIARSTFYYLIHFQVLELSLCLMLILSTDPQPVHS